MNGRVNVFLHTLTESVIEKVCLWLIENGTRWINQMQIAFNDMNTEYTRNSSMTVGICCVQFVLCTEGEL